MRAPHLLLAKNYWKGLLKSSDWAIDSTCGNGYDTLFLAGICSVIGIDIQRVAVQNTKALLEKEGRQALIYCLSHEAIDQIPLPSPPKLIVYNLGYLPGGEKSITTQTESTLSSLDKSLRLLAPGGALSVVCYPGHEEGLREEQAIGEWAARLPYAVGSACHHRWVNRTRAPSLFWIVKKSSEGLFADP
ncbi:MAG: class I SAM-dependent methyltransferase [Chlamydiales bacterium]